MPNWYGCFVGIGTYKGQRRVRILPEEAREDLCCSKIPCVYNIPRPWAGRQALLFWLQMSSRPYESSRHIRTIYICVCVCVCVSRSQGGLEFGSRWWLRVSQSELVADTIHKASLRPSFCFRWNVCIRWFPWMIDTKVKHKNVQVEDNQSINQSINS